MRRLTGLDAAFVYMETATNHMHLASTAVFDPSTMPGGYTFAVVRDLVRARLPLLPPFRRRLREVPFNLHHPVWIEDPAFDLDYHVRRASLPSPGGDAELAEFAADVFSRGLDRRRPLWEMHVVEGLQGGLFAVITKAHHAAIDGVSGVELTAKLLDIQAEPVAPPAEDQAWEPERVPTDLELLADAARHLAGRVGPALRGLRLLAEVALSPRQDNGGPGAVPTPRLFQAPKTAFNVTITPHRRFAFADVSLEDVKTIKNAAGATVNDVVLALCAGALRRYLLAKNGLPDAPMVALVPVSVRADVETDTLGNRISAMLVSLATDVSDPADRLDLIVSAARAAKENHQAVGAEALTEWTEFLAPAVVSRAARVLASSPVMDRLGPAFNVVVSNIPGPDFPLYSAGARLVGFYPMGPIADGVALNMTVMSYLGRINFGLVACRESVSDLPALAGSIQPALAELLEAVTAPRPSGKASTAPRPADRGATAGSGLLT